MLHVYYPYKQKRSPIGVILKRCSENIRECIGENPYRSSDLQPYWNNILTELFLVTMLRAIRLPVVFFYNALLGDCSCKSHIKKQFCNFIKKGALAQVFLVNFAKSPRTPFLQNTSGRLLLKRATMKMAYFGFINIWYEFLKAWSVDLL